MYLEVKELTFFLKADLKMILDPNEFRIGKSLKLKIVNVMKQSFSTKKKKKHGMLTKPALNIFPTLNFETVIGFFKLITFQN